MKLMLRNMSTLFGPQDDTRFVNVSIVLFGSGSYQNVSQLIHIVVYILYKTTGELIE